VTDGAAAGAVLPDLLMVVAVVLVACALTALAGALWLRRRWRRLLLVLGGRAQAAAAEAGRTGWRWALAQPLPDARWRHVTRARRQVLLAVSSAERAVDAAAVAGAPVGDLPQLARRLRSAADAVDASLAVGQRDPRTRREAGEATTGQVREVLRAAACIHDAAALALTASSERERTGLVRDAERELTAIATGARRAAEASGTPGDGTPGPGVPGAGRPGDDR
jgi:hypothetical protein